MLSREEVLEKLRKQKPILEKKYSLKMLGLFGSYARNEQKNTSDIDLIVDFNKPIGIDFVIMAEEIEENFNLKVDLVSKNAIKDRYYKEFEKEIIYV
jgi:hypothetical protein